MRKIIVLTFVSLDGVMQAPGGPDEDISSGFTLGGWSVPFFDETLGEVMAKQMGVPFDLLLGCKTYDIFASYWPQHPEEGASLNSATKYVVSHQKRALPYGPAKLVTGDVVNELKKIKETNGPDLQVHGSSELIQTLLKNNLVDELWLKIFPVALGNGKRLFGDGTIPASFKLKEFLSAKSGVIIASYEFIGDLKTGSF